jgi:uncharacterized protein YxjI
MANCPQCNNEARYVQEYNAWYCDACQQYLPTGQGGGQQPAAQPQQTGNLSLAQQQFGDTVFTIKQKMLAIANKYFVENSAGQTVGFVQQKMFKLKEDIRVFTDDTKTTEVMRIQQANILDFSGSFQVMDSQTGQLIGILKRKGWKSLLKDEWKILDANQTEIGKIREQGGIVWLLRRFKFTFIPYKYFIEIGGQDVGTVTEKFQIIGDTYIVDISRGGGMIDPRLAVAIGLMMDIGEGE